jgi:hypothetical protein
MTSQFSTVNNQIGVENPLERWQSKSRRCQTDLIIKKIAVVVIATLNMAALGCVLYYVIAHCPFPHESVLDYHFSGFLSGALGGLAVMQFPTFGLQSARLTPSTLSGKIAAYILFGPLMYTLNRADWTRYHEPFRAMEISDDLATRPFSEIATLYGKQCDHLVKYGFIDAQYKQELKGLYTDYRNRCENIDKMLKAWEGRQLSPGDGWDQARRTSIEFQGRWDALKNKFGNVFPHPIIQHDSKWGDPWTLERLSSLKA